MSLLNRLLLSTAAVAAAVHAPVMLHPLGAAIRYLCTRPSHRQQALSILAAIDEHASRLERQERT